MATDSAITRDVRKPDGTNGGKVYYGAQKLFVVPKLRAGIAYWGWVFLPQPGSDWLSDEKKQDLLELWLPHFLECNKDRYDSISDLAQLLENELRKRIPKIDVKEHRYGDGGIHLAGYESESRENGDLLPTFWHIHNGLSQALPNKKLNPAIVNANNDIPLTTGRKIVETPGLATIRNGDIESYVVLWELLFRPDSAFSQIVKTVDLTFPYVDSLAERASLLKFQIQMVAGIYQFSKEGTGIGSPIATLTISRAKSITYSPV
jgi:hypothetical protein